MTPIEEQTPETPIHRQKFETALNALSLQFTIDNDPYDFGENIYNLYSINYDEYTYFSALARFDDNTIYIELPDCIEIPYEEISLLSATEPINEQFAEVRVYFENNSKGSIVLSVRSQIVLWAKNQEFINNYLKDLFELMIYVRQTFVSEYKSHYVHKYKSYINQLNNPGKELNEEEQLLLLLFERMHEYETNITQYSIGPEITNNRLSVKFGLPDQIEIHDITLQGKKLEKMPQKDDEWCKLLLEQNEDGSYFVGKTKKCLQFHVNYLDEEGEEVQNTISTLVSYEGKYDQCHFIRATFSLLPQDNKVNGPAIWECKSPTRRSFSYIFYLDESENRERSLQELYVGINEEIQESLNNQKDDDEISNEALLVKQLEYPDLIMMYSWCIDLFSSRQFDKALKISERTLRIFEYFFFKSNDDQKNIYYRLLHNIAYCLLVKKRPEEALYYIDTCYFENNNHNHLIQYINSLVLSRDVRAIPTINRWLSNLSESEEKNKDSQTIRLQEFLDRRKPFALIDQRFFDEARKDLNQLKNAEEGDPFQKQFAEYELRYLNKLKTENGRKFNS